MADTLIEENHELKGFRPDRLERIEEILAADIESRKIPGAVVLLARGGQPEYWREPSDIAIGRRMRQCSAMIFPTSHR
jgi:hypothetical protein